MKILSSISYRGNKYGLKLYTKVPTKEDYSKVIIIAANPRGGSTWLEDVLGRLRKSVCYYEPLNPSYIPELAEMGFSMRNHIPQTSIENDTKEYFKKLFLGKLFNNRMTFHPMSKKQNIYDVINAKKRVFKFCRLNLMLPWLVDTFPQIAPPILLLRHPCAVVASQIKFGNVNGGGWKHVHSQLGFLSQKHSDYFQPYRAFCLSLKHKEEILAAVWCLTNKYPLEHEYNNRRWLTISYEDLLLNTNDVINQICSKLNISNEFDILVNYTSQHVASKTSINKKQIDKHLQLESWKHSLSNQEINNIMRVVNFFEMDKFYNNNLVPNYKELYNQK
ncbi:sulfotransferase [Reichenbachiella agariperforans]|uniref:sulfotransferase n=1 Tax=Reichenbachiella agariperforans TaxID=156994 RepID=UPI001C08CD51|nr:sulfotransferase [Reichenbachiella agariperforans]MBU2915201.1 sulfotransferase [Reichenbachiella agariperforans]